ncbi:MAG: hypothetical protein CBC29_06315 [Methylococcaceae bacterium TMED69]|nr:MAG: hypothetical protein CBC29_06315 [Methylococcaceae bacterium TMED69]|tara:strand:- start:838 stop:1023 length:186 start_codon:yes stop_codon:yes gene_type:complete
MYIVEIKNKTSNAAIGPAMFSGSGEEFEKLIDAISAARDWINKNCENPDNWKVSHRIIGCL